MSDDAAVLLDRAITRAAGRQTAERALRWGVRAIGERCNRLTRELRPANAAAALPMS